MASFLDFVQQGGNSSIPDWLMGMIPGGLSAIAAGKRPTDTNIQPYLQTLATQTGQAGNFANTLAPEYLQGAINFNRDALQVGSPAALDEAAGRNAAVYRQAMGAKRASLDRTTAGMNPNSGGVMAQRAALNAAEPLGLVQSMNTGRTAERDKGFALRAAGLPMIAPNFGPAISGAAMGASVAERANASNRANYNTDLTNAARVLKQNTPTTPSGVAGSLDSFSKWLNGNSYPDYSSQANLMPQYDISVPQSIMDDASGLNFDWG